MTSPFLYKQDQTQMKYTASVEQMVAKIHAITQLFLMFVKQSAPKVTFALKDIFVMLMVVAH